MLMSSGKIRPSVWMCACMMAWAVTSACTALVHDYKGLVLVRFFLGVTEAPYYPGALFLLSLFYTRKEIATRISILYSGNIIATAFSGLIAAAVFNTIDGNYGLEGWRWVSRDRISHIPHFAIQPLQYSADQNDSFSLSRVL